MTARTDFCRRRFRERAGQRDQHRFREAVAGLRPVEHQDGNVRRVRATGRGYQRCGTVGAFMQVIPGSGPILNPRHGARKARNAGLVRALPKAMSKRRTKSRRAKRGGARRSGRVTRESDALTLERGVFTKSSPRKIARSLKRSADRSRRRKSNSYRSAMSMLTFFINRVGKGSAAARKAGKGQGRAARALWQSRIRRLTCWRRRLRPKRRIGRRGG